MSVSGYVHMSAGANGGKARASDPLELEESIHLTQVLGTEFRFFGRPANVLDHLAVSLAPNLNISFFFNF